MLHGGAGRPGAEGDAEQALVGKSAVAGTMWWLAAPQLITRVTGHTLHSYPESAKIELALSVVE